MQLVKWLQFITHTYELINYLRLKTHYKLRYHSIRSLLAGGFLTFFLTFLFVYSFPLAPDSPHNTTHKHTHTQFTLHARVSSTTAWLGVLLSLQTWASRTPWPRRHWCVDWEYVGQSIPSRPCDIAYPGTTRWHTIPKKTNKHEDKERVTSTLVYSTWTNPNSCTVYYNVCQPVKYFHVIVCCGK